MQTFDIGDQPTVTAHFVDRVTREPVDPTAITVKVRHPDGTFDTYSEADCTNPEVGTWEFTFPTPLDEENRWTVKFYGTEGAVAAEQISFSVRCSEMDES